VSRFREGWLLPGLPDGLVSNQKSKFGQILEGPRLENDDIFYGHLGYFMTIRDFCFHLVHFFPVLVSYTKKNLATLIATACQLLHL
jgi:hypothetical protein